jgi:hypothetical protein
MLDMPTETMSIDQLQRFGAACSYIRRLVPYVNEGTCNNHVEDLRNLYNTLAEKSLSTNAFGRMLRSQGVEPVRTRRIVSSTQPTTAQRAVTIEWKTDDLLTLQRLKQRAQKSTTGETA